MGRKESRETVFKALYQMDIRKCQLSEIIDSDLNEKNYTTKDIDYINTVTSGISQNLSEIDKKLSESVKGWTLNRISKICKAALRLAVYEIYNMDDIPISISIYEAVELVKTFDSPEAGGFVNGILRGIVRNDKKDEAVNKCEQ